MMHKLIVDESFEKSLVGTLEPVVKPIFESCGVHDSDTARNAE